MTNFTPHAIRRTVATFLTSELGVARLVVSKILNHTETGVTKVYDRASYDRKKRTALHGWGLYLEQVVASEPSKSARPDVLPAAHRNACPAA